MFEVSHLHLLSPWIRGRGEKTDMFCKGDVGEWICGGRTIDHYHRRRELVRPPPPPSSPALKMRKGKWIRTDDFDPSPGFPDGIRGPEMMDLFRAQSIRFGTEIHTETISKIGE